MKLGSTSSEAWAERNTNTRERDTVNGMRHEKKSHALKLCTPQIRVWSMAQPRRLVSCPLTRSLPKCFAFEGLGAFMRSWMNVRGRLRNAGVLRLECFQPHHFLTWRQETGQASWSVGETNFMFNCNSMFLKIFKRARE